MDARPIRVLFVVPDLRFGGAERHVVTLLPRMDRNKFASSAVCIGDEGELFAELTESGIEAEALHSGGRANAFRGLRGLIRIMRRQRPDVVVMRGYSAEMLGRIAALVTGVPHSVLWVHNVGEIEPRSRFRKTMDRVLESSTTRYFGVAEAQRTYMAEELGYPENDIRIIHNGVDTAAFNLHTDPADLSEFGIAKDDAVVGIVAALRPEKDHENLLYAARELLKERPNTKILIVGEGPRRDVIKDLSAKLGIERSVCFTGKRNDIARVLHAVDVLVLCSFTVECFPISLLEAMACGRPVVCTDVGGVGEIVENGVTGYLVPARNPQALADRLKHVLSDPERAKLMGQAGRARVESDFSLERSVKNAERAIEEVVGVLKAN